MWRTIKSDTVIEDYHVTVKKNAVQLPDGALINDFYTVTIPDAAMVAAITPEGKILLKTEFRYAVGEDVIECPAGMFEKDENDPLTVAKRELLEETGYTRRRSSQTGCICFWQRIVCRHAGSTLTPTSI